MEGFLKIQTRKITNKFNVNLQDDIIPAIYHTVINKTAWISRGVLHFKNIHIFSISPS